MEYVTFHAALVFGERDEDDNMTADELNDLLTLVDHGHLHTLFRHSVT